MKRSFGLLLLFVCSFLGCGISGEIVPVWTDHSYKGKFEFTEYSHAIIKLYLEESSDSNPTVSTHRIDHIKSFPIDYSIPFPSNVDIEKLRISAKVISGQGDETKLGDFVTETVTPVKRWSSTIVEVVGLESCEAPHAGGICGTNEK